MGFAGIGEVPEWLNGAVSKTVVGLVPTVGSNPTLSAGRKILVAAKAAHYRRPQSFGDSESHSNEGLRQRSLSSRWAISLLRYIPFIVYTPPLLSRYCGTSEAGFRHRYSLVRYLPLCHSCPHAPPNALSNNAALHPGATRPV